MTHCATIAPKCAHCGTIASKCATIAPKCAHCGVIASKCAHCGVIARNCGDCERNCDSKCVSAAFAIAAQSKRNRIHGTTLVLLLLFVLPLVSDSFTWFHHHDSNRVKRASPDECCVSSKLNVGSKKANTGREFFRKLATEADSYKEITPENMCNLIHFLIQQASLNNKSITFTKGQPQCQLFHPLTPPSLFRHVRHFRFD